MINIKNHLIIDREMDIYRYSVSYNKETACFLLYNLSGKIVGYQQYRPSAPKSYKNNPKSGRYFTYCKNNIGVFGLESFNYRTDVLFVVEGVFDSVKLHNLGFSAIATLTNNPKHLSSWLNSLGRITISVSDNDAAGNKLFNICNYNLKIPTNYKDLGEMPMEAIKDLIFKLLG
jgi:DNA primase